MLLPLTVYRPGEFSYKTGKKSKQSEPQKDVSWITERGTLHMLTWLCPQSKPRAVQAVLHKKREGGGAGEGRGSGENSQHEMKARCYLSREVK